MASTNKTNKGLNQWVLTDHPVMSDFNADNNVISAKAMWKDDYDPSGAVKAAGGIASFVGIASGSNANGSYLKFPDGTLVCWKRLTVTNQVNRLVSNGQYLGPETDLGGWAIPFVGAPVCQTTVNALDSGSKNFNLLSGGMPTSTWCSVVYVVGPTPEASSSSKNIDVLGFGRWK